MTRISNIFFVFVVFALSAWAQTGAVRGVVKDSTGAIIPKATVTVTDSAGAAHTATTQGDGTYIIRGLAPGTYTVSADYANMQPASAVLVTVASGKTAVGDVTMTVQEQKQQITVTDSVDNQVSTEAGSNASALVLKKEDLDALPDDPDDLQADLQALAGPSASPGGTQIYIDGFTGGRLPPKASIREIRVNSNPFSAEFDKLGYGRIQIFTKPGTDKFHGQGYYDISDDIWNSKNPFLTVSPPFRTQQFGGNVSGPISKTASFFIDFERRNIDDNGIVNANIPQNGFGNSTPYTAFYPTPQRRTTFSPRVDWQLGTKQTLSFRYTLLDNSQRPTGIGSFDLPATTIAGIPFGSTGNYMATREQSAQAVDTVVLNPNVVNETHFEYERNTTNRTSLSTSPMLDVSQSFVLGGNGYSSSVFPNSYDTDNYYEIQNYTTMTLGAHTVKFGMRVRADNISDLTPQNFNGQYAFLGGTFPVLGANLQPTGATATLTSVQQFLTTEQLLASGISPAAVTTQYGYGPSKFTINTGNPYISVHQIDFGPFIQDDWRARPNLTLSFGLRFEDQTNISDNLDFAPRVGFAWAPGGGSPTGLQKSKTVIRGGWGVFYERFPIDDVLTAYRYGRNAGGEQIYTVNNPTFYDAAFSTTPSISTIQQAAAQQNAAAQTATLPQFYQIDPQLKAPRLMQAVLGFDRQLASRTSLSINVIDSRGVHLLLTDDINAPFVTGDELPPGALGQHTDIEYARPYGDIGDIYDYQSTGLMKQVQAMASVNSAVGKWLTLHGYYAYTQAHDDTSGLGSMPGNPWDINADWGRSTMDVHHRAFVGGSFAIPWGLRLSPFIVAHSGTPFNIVTGSDLFLTGNTSPTARPEISDVPVPGVTQALTGIAAAVVGPYVIRDPVANAPTLERNFGTGPGFIGVNLRLSKTWGFGSTHFQGQVGGARAGGFGGHGGGWGGMDSVTEKRYNLTASINARNILNHANLNTPNGVLTSPYFFDSTNITGGYGAESTSSDQRRIDMQLRFMF